MKISYTLHTLTKVSHNSANTFASNCEKMNKTNKNKRAKVKVDQFPGYNYITNHGTR